MINRQFNVFKNISKFNEIQLLTIPNALIFQHIQDFFLSFHPKQFDNATKAKCIIESEIEVFSGEDWRKDNIGTLFKKTDVYWHEIYIIEDCRCQRSKKFEPEGSFTGKKWEEINCYNKCVSFIYLVKE